MRFKVKHIVFPLLYVFMVYFACYGGTLWTDGDDSFINFIQFGCIVFSAIIAISWIIYYGIDYIKEILDYEIEL